MKTKNITTVAGNLLAILTIAIVTMFIGLNKANGQGVVSSSSGGGSEISFATLPEVPVEVVMKGRRAVASHLLFEVDSANVSFDGASLAGSLWQGITPIDFQRLGYTHRGAYDEIRNAIANIPFRARVVPTPQGWYEVNCKVGLMTEQGKEAFTARGGLYIRRTQDGALVSDNFNPYVELNANILVRIPDLSRARWVDRNNQTEELMIVGVPDGNNGWQSYAVFPTRHLEDGSLLLADYRGNIFACDLRENRVITGEEITVILGSVSSTIMHVVSDPSSISLEFTCYRTGDGRLVGRYPLIIATFDSPFSVLVDVRANIWGTQQYIYPSEASYTPTYIDGDPGDLIVGEGRDIPQIPESNLRLLKGPAGGYHIRVEFADIWDWESDGGGKGK